MFNQSTPLVLTVEEAGKLLRLSRPTAYKVVNRGEIPALRLGRRLLIPRAALEKMLADVKPLNKTS
jgi:excisionase family DNA binding protein